MMKNTRHFNTPILFLIFNRPDRAQLVFDEIKKQKPKKLFIHADGPRLGNIDDIAKCKASREIIEHQIDWDCNIFTLFRDKNLGCKEAPASAITWFFENVEEGIILEDDCLPHPDFFQFCSIMLEKYRTEPRVMSIAGSNFQNGKIRDSGSYYFSIHNRIWGWAAWKNTWIGYDGTIRSIDKDTFYSKVNELFLTKKERLYWKGLFSYVKESEEYNSWDYQFMFMLWVRNELTIVPNVNLISNIGDGDDATHTNWINNPNLRIPTYSILPVIFNNEIKRNRKADQYYFSHFILIQKSLMMRVFSKVKKLKKYLR